MSNIVVVPIHRRAHWAQRHTEHDSDIEPAPLARSSARPFDPEQEVCFTVRMRIPRSDIETRKAIAFELRCLYPNAVIG